MFANLDRDEFIQLLRKLGSEDDEEALTAARDLHARVTVAGIAWDDLLVPEEDEYDEDDEDDEVLDGAYGRDDEGGEEDDDVLAADDDESPLDETEKTEALGLIDKLMERDVSETTREELEEYKTDIAEGEFVAMDLRYLRALHKRLTN